MDGGDRRASGSARAPRPSSFRVGGALPSSPPPRLPGGSGYVVYVLASTAKPGRTYVGCTNNPARRIRQHNGGLAGGARYTQAWRPWRFAFVVSGFGSDGKRDALSFEWHLKHKSRRPRRRRRTGHPAGPAGPAGPGQPPVAPAAPAVQTGGGLPEEETADSCTPARRGERGCRCPSSLARRIRARDMLLTLDRWKSMGLVVHDLI